jgi:NADPH2:quinone reductase
MVKWYGRSMRRVVCTEIGSLHGLVVEERPDLEPRPGQLVVDVAAAGVTAVDALLVLGRYPLAVPAPFVPGHEVAGTVRAVGEGVVGWSPGDRVMTLQGIGSYASQVALPAFMAMAPPPNLSEAQAGSLLQAYSTALLALRRLSVQPGERVLVLGAGGGVGLALVDTVTALGAVALGAASTDGKRKLAEVAGAAAVIDDTVDDLAGQAKAAARDLGGSVDVVIDLVGGSIGAAGLAALGRRGRFGVLGTSSGEELAIPAGRVLIGNRSVVGIDCGEISTGDPMGYYQAFTEAAAWAAEGKIHPVEPTPHPLAEAAGVLRDLIERRIEGKVVLVP